MCAKTAQSGKKRGQAPAVCGILKKYKIVTKWAGARHVPAYVEVYGYGSHSEPYGVGHHGGTGAAGAAGAAHGHDLAVVPDHPDRSGRRGAPVVVGQYLLYSR